MAAACAPRAADSGSIPVPTDPCVTAVGDGADTLTVSLDADPSPSHAPVPSNAAEHLVFRQAYETLVRLDCEARLLPALAERWRGDSAGRVWVVELGERRFADGTPVTAHRVIDSWARTGAVGRSLDHAEARNDRTLVVTLARAEPSGPLALANPALAIGASGSQDPWPLASGAYRIVSAPAAAGQPPEHLATPAAAGAPVLRLLVSERVDERDLLAAGTDLMITRDPRTLEYAGRLTTLRTIPLPWDRTYVMVFASARPIDTGADSAGQARFRAALARDAVTASARGAEPALTSDSASACGAGPAGARHPMPRIAYPRADSTARQLAERIVALASGRLLSIGLEADALDAALRAGSHAAVILPADRRASPACRSLPALPAGSTVEPLIDTRAHLVLRRGGARISLDADGIPRILPDTSQ